MFVALFGAYRVISWRVKNHLSEFTKDVVTCWIWVFGSIGVSKGWFAMSRQLSPEGEKWHPLMFEWRWVVVMLTAMGATWGILSFIQLIDEYSDVTKLFIFALLFCSSRIIGIY